MVAYRLSLPEGIRIYNVFHVSLLKPHYGSSPTVFTELPPLLDGKTLFAPFKVLRGRNTQGKPELLVQWVAGAEESVTWEDWQTFQEAYPDFEFEEKLNMEEGRTYSHRPKETKE